MKKTLFLVVVLVIFFSSCADYVDDGILLRPSKFEELNNFEKDYQQNLFGTDMYWRVRLNSGDTLNVILPDYIQKSSGDRVEISVEGNKKDFFCAR